MLIAIWNMITHCTCYREPGADSYTRLKGVSTGDGDRSDLGEIIYPRGVGYAASSTGPLWWVKHGYRRVRQTVGAKLRARLACESSAGELLVEHPDVDSIAALDFSTYPQFSADSHGLPRSRVDDLPQI
jgi:hypothetical protein